MEPSSLFSSFLFPPSFQKKKGEREIGEKYDGAIAASTGRRNRLQSVFAALRAANSPAKETEMERTLVLLKPDCVQRRLIGRVLARLEQKGLNLVAMKLLRVTPELARRHYAEHVAKDWYAQLERFITSGPLVAAIVEGPEAIRVVRDMVGVTNGLQAAPGTIRGDYSSSRQMNLVHASDGPDAARREIEVFFRPGNPPLRAGDWSLARRDRRKLIRFQVSDCWNLI